jgi:hypothetical protein
MTADRHFKAVLAELSPYLDNPPLPGSAEQQRFDELIAEVASHAALGPDHPHADEIHQLGAKIEAVTRRRQAERRALDLAPGDHGMAPLLGGDLHPPPPR